MNFLRAKGCAWFGLLQLLGGMNFLKSCFAHFASVENGNSVVQFFQLWYILMDIFKSYRKVNCFAKPFFRSPSLLCLRRRSRCLSDRFKRNGLQDKRRMCLRVFDYTSFSSIIHTHAISMKEILNLAFICRRTHH